MPAAISFKQGSCSANSTSVLLYTLPNEVTAGIISLTLANTSTTPVEVTLTYGGGNPFLVFTLGSFEEEDGRIIISNKVLGHQGLLSNKNLTATISGASQVNYFLNIVEEYPLTQGGLTFFTSKTLEGTTNGTNWVNFNLNNSNFTKGIFTAYINNLSTDAESVIEVCFDKSTVQLPIRYKLGKRGESSNRVILDRIIYNNNAVFGIKKVNTSDTSDIRIVIDCVA